MSVNRGPGREPAQTSGATVNPLPKERRIISPDRALISDIDNTLLGDPEALKSFVRLLHKHRGTTVFGVASGRRLESALRALEEWSAPMPDVLITAVGT